MTIQENIREIEPNVIFYGARQWEGIYAMIHVKMASASKINCFFYDFFMSVARKQMQAKSEQKRIGQWRQLLWNFSNIFVLKPVRNKLGLNRIRYTYTAGAAISPEIIRYFQTAGINIKQLYESGHGRYSSV